MEINQHPANAHYIVVKSPTQEALELANRLATGRWARIEKSGNITVHTNYRADFERMTETATTGKAERRYVTREEFADGIGACVGWNVVENAGTNQATWRKA